MQQWSIRQAKDHLSALLQAAKQQPQIITNRGNPSYVLLSQEAFDRLARRSASSLVDFFGSSGLDEIEFERVPAAPREDHQL